MIMTNQWFAGLDPGASGGVAFLNADFGSACAYKFDGMTERDIWDLVRQYRDQNGGVLFACLEQVSAMPGQGVTSMFKFGQSYGFLRGMLTAAEVPMELVTPQKWQKAIGCMTKGDKNVSKAKAQQLFPSVKITHAIADALLIAEYARRTWVSRQAA